MIFQDEVVLITGGSGGIGLAAARRFAAHGARVVLTARTRSGLEAAALQLGPRGRAIPADVCDAGTVRALVDDVQRSEGRLDVLVNCAGRFEIGPAAQAGPEVAEALIRTNYLGPVHVIHACLPLLHRSRRRSIVNVSSLAGKIAPPFMAAYAGSKFALAGYTYSLRQELAADGFHVGLVSPGPVDTPMIHGKVRTSYYPLLPGLPVITAERTAAAIVRCVRRRRADVVPVWHVGGVVRIGQAFPGLVDLAYRLVRR